MPRKKELSVYVCGGCEFTIFAEPNQKIKCYRCNIIFDERK